MSKSFQSWLLAGAFVGILGCATPQPFPEPVPGAPAAANQPGVSQPGYSETLSASDPVNAMANGPLAVTVVEKVRADRDAKVQEKKVAAAAITIDCSVKLPDDPTDNPELCRSFQMEIVDDTGAEAGRFRFGIDARYRFAGRPGKKYRIRPVIGKNWEFSVDPDRALVVGERVRVQLKQKQ